MDVAYMMQLEQKGHGNLWRNSNQPGRTFVMEDRLRIPVQVLVNGHIAPKMTMLANTWYRFRVVYAAIEYVLRIYENPTGDASCVHQLIAKELWGAHLVVTLACPSSTADVTRNTTVPLYRWHAPWHCHSPPWCPLQPTRGRMGSTFQRPRAWSRRGTSSPAAEPTSSFPAAAPWGKSPARCRSCPPPRVVGRSALLECEGFSRRCEPGRRLWGVGGVVLRDFEKGR